jgi:D-hydroxyproline dehydrogenase subunit beta
MPRTRSRWASISDVVVIGAGIVGAATARELAVRGAPVLLLDRGDVSSGTTGLGEGNVLACDKAPGPELELTLAGLSVYDELERRLGDEARIRRKGALVVHPDAATWAEEPERVDRLRDAGVEAELLDDDAARTLEPHLTGELHGASRFPRDLQCDPRAITLALVREAVAAGAELRTGCAVEAIERRAGRVAGVRLAGQPLGAPSLATEAVVLAAGAWSAAPAASAGLPLPVEPRWGQLVRLAAPDEPRSGRLASAGEAAWIRHKVIDGSYMGSVLSSDAGLQVTTVLETTWDGHVLVGSSRARRGFGTEVDPAVSEAMVVRAARLMPELTDLRVDAAWAGLRAWLPDHLPAIGASRAVPGLWVATGHEGAGVALGPVTGRLVAQALCGESTLVDLAAFDPDRFRNGSRRRVVKPPPVGG